MVFNLKGVKVEITFFFVAFISFVISLEVPSNVLVTVLSSMFHELGHLFFGLKAKLYFDSFNVLNIRTNSLPSLKHNFMFSVFSDRYVRPSTAERLAPQRTPRRRSTIFHPVRHPYGCKS